MGSVGLGKNPGLSFECSYKTIRNKGVSALFGRRFVKHYSVDWYTHNRHRICILPRSVIGNFFSRGTMGLPLLFVKSSPLEICHMYPAITIPPSLLGLQKKYYRTSEMDKSGCGAKLFTLSRDVKLWTDS